MLLDQPKTSANLHSFRASGRRNLPIANHLSGMLRTSAKARSQPPTLEPEPRWRLAGFPMLIETRCAACRHVFSFSRPAAT